MPAENAPAARANHFLLNDIFDTQRARVHQENGLPPIENISAEKPICRRSTAWTALEKPGSGGTLIVEKELRTRVYKS
jgi:hypothetical protein